MADVIEWCNTNSGFTSAALAVLSLIVSFIAVCISIRTSKRQNKTALLEKRQQFIDDMELYVTKQLNSWEFDLSKVTLFLKYSDTYAEALFGKDALDFLVDLKKSSEDIDALWGDYKHAENHGDCRNKTPEDIEKEIHSICNKTENQFFKLKNSCVKKFLKL